MKKIIFALVFLICGITNCNSQINNLKDLLEISELTVEEMVENLQYTWNTKPPYQEFFDNNKLVKEYIIFDYKGEREKGDRKQTLKRVTIGNISNGEKIHTTEFISNEKYVFNRIKNNLKNWGSELQAQGKIISLYSDGNLLLKIQTESYKDTKLPNGYYSIQILIGSKSKTYESYLKSLSTKSEESKNIGTNNALNNISNSSNKIKEKINLVKNLSELILISKTSSSEIYSKLNSNWKNIDYPKNEEPLNEWFSVVNEKQYLESYVGWDNGIGKDVRITTFEFSDKNLLDNFIIDLSKPDFKLEEKTKEYSTYVNNDDIITIFFDNKTSKKGNYKVELSITPSKATINSGSNYKNYNDNGTGLNGRKIIKKPSPEYNCNEQGKVVVEITVDKNGNVINAIAGVDGTTNKSACLLNASKIAALRTKWQPNNNAPDKQIGKIEYNFRLN